MKIKTLLAASLLLMLLGCSKLTMENYDKISVGMHYDEVTKLLGPPGRCDEVVGIRKCVWNEGKRTIKVSFAGSQAVLFSASNLK